MPSRVEDSPYRLREAGPDKRRAGQRQSSGGGGRVAGPLVELVQPADVVVMPVGRSGHETVIDEVGDLRTKADHPEAGIDQEIAVAAPDVPDVAAHGRVGVRLDK